MNSDFAVKTIFFRGITPEEMSEAEPMLRIREKNYKKEEVILAAGDITSFMGLVTEGSVRIESNDIWGNRTILSHVGQGQAFAETYAYLENEPLLVDVVANEDCSVMFVSLSALKELVGNNNRTAVKIMSNLLTVLSKKNLALSGRSFHTAPKTVRGRLMSYLNMVSLQKGSKSFDIPFDRQQLADYLNLDRTALSKELGKMQREGILKSVKNHFVLMK